MAPHLGKSVHKGELLFFPSSNPQAAPRSGIRQTTHWWATGGPDGKAVKYWCSRGLRGHSLKGWSLDCEPRTGCTKHFSLFLDAPRRQAGSSAGVNPRAGSGAGWSWARAKARCWGGRGLCGRTSGRHRFSWSPFSPALRSPGELPRGLCTLHYALPHTPTPGICGFFN
uniref:Uncharacterized protein n=1 Tax=Dromaius novaehollandiae TaxID=8790 RepID=A0A8C4J9Z0_DRONO